MDPAKLKVIELHRRGILTLSEIAEQTKKSISETRQIIEYYEESKRIDDEFEVGNSNTASRRRDLTMLATLCRDLRNQEQQKKLIEKQLETYQNQINGDSLDKENIKVLKSLYDIRDNAQNTHIKIMEKIKDFTDDADSFVTPQDFSAINKQLDELLSAS
mgnify:FL=1